MNAPEFGVLEEEAADDRPGYVSLVSMEVVNGSARAEAVDLRILRDTVEVTYLEGKRIAVFSRDVLRRWLQAPGLPLVGGELIFVLDHHQRMALILPGVEPWPLAPDFLAIIEREV